MIKISNKIQHKVRCVFSNGPVPSHTVDTFSYSLSPETTQCCSFDKTFLQLLSPHQNCLTVLKPVIVGERVMHCESGVLFQV